MKKRLGWIAVYIIVVLLLAAVIYGMPSLVGFIRGTYIAKSGTVTMSEDVDAYLLRNQTVYTTDMNCSIRRIAKAGDLVGAGDKVVEVNKTHGLISGTQYGDLMNNVKKNLTRSNDGTTSDAGFVMYEVDGLEDDFSPSNLPNLTEKKLSGFGIGKPKKISKGNARKDSPLFKIAENGPWGIVFFVDKKKSEHYYIDRTIELEFKNQDNTIRGKVVAAEEKSGRVRVVLQSQDYFKGLLSLRKAKIHIVVGKGTGLIIRNTSIIEKDGERGVIVKDKVGNNVFKPISVIAGDGSKSAVYDDIFVDEKGEFVETLTIYDKVVSHPSKKEIKEADELPNNKAKK